MRALADRIIWVAQLLIVRQYPHLFLRILISISQAAPCIQGTPAPPPPPPPPPSQGRRQYLIRICSAGHTSIPEPPHLPLFSPKESGGTSGLHLLAQAAGSISNPDPTHNSQTPHLLSSGPFNPAASLPPKLVKKILDLDFVEMSEITTDDNLPNTPGRPPAPARLPITDISQWVERFSIMAAILATRFPDKSPELWAYQATIVRAERNYDGKRWVTYDRQYRREALARKDLNWSVTDPRLYNEAFTGHAKAIPRCTYCLQDDHSAAFCPRNPTRPYLGYFPTPVPWQATMPSGDPHYMTPSSSQEICRCFNEGRC